MGEGGDGRLAGLDLRPSLVNGRVDHEASQVDDTTAFLASTNHGACNTETREFRTASERERSRDAVPSWLTRMRSETVITVSAQGSVSEEGPLNRSTYGGKQVQLSGVRLVSSRWRLAELCDTHKGSPKSGACSRDHAR